MKVLNNNLGLPVRNMRTSNAGMSVKDVFDPNGGLPASAAAQIYGHTAAAGQSNLAYEPISDDEGRNSLRLNPRNQVSWSNNLSRL